MVFFKSCERCSGDQTLEHDFEGWYVLCLLCGNVTYPELDLEEERVRQLQANGHSHMLLGSQHGLLGLA